MPVENEVRRVTQVKVHKVKSRLSGLAFRPGGINIADALKRADSAIEELRPPCLEDLDAALANLDRRFGRAAGERADDDYKAVYLYASRIIDSSLGLPGSGIELAARALCEFVDIADERGIRDWDAVDVHIDTLKLLRAAGVAMSKAQRDSVLDGLAKVARKRFGE
jgi:hypothetical protein